MPAETDITDIAKFAVKAAEARNRTDAADLKFSTTAELEPIAPLAGQDRAIAALKLGTAIKQQGFHLFALGPHGARMSDAVRRFLEAKATGQKQPDDWIYVSNFETLHKPRAIALAAGRAVPFAKSVREAIEELRAGMRAIFEGDVYESRRGVIEEEAQSAQEASFSQLNEEASENDIAILRTPVGFAMAPMRDGQVVKPEEFNALPEEERKKVQEKIEALQEKLQQILKNLPAIEKKRRRRLRELNEELAAVAVTAALDDVVREYSDNAEIAAHLEVLKKELIANAMIFMGDGSHKDEVREQPGEMERDARFRRYLVNTIVGDEIRSGAPVIEADNPTMANLVGRIEHLSQMGALITDFMLIKPGALHAANGGYLLIDARKLLSQPFSWEALKRALKGREIRIESAAEQYSLVTTVTLQPDTIPLSVKCVLFGERRLYYLLSAFDPEFTELFKLAADFEDETDRGEQGNELYAGMIASIVDRCGLRPVTARGVARLIDEGARLADDATKLLLDVERVDEILCEADYWASEAGRDSIDMEDVDRAVREAVHRMSRIRERSQEAIERDIIRIETSGSHVGQVNGLSVFTLGQMRFGRPSRISARVRMGTGKIVDIEREVELGGPLHSKGILILKGFIEGRYAQKFLLSLSASLVFEQSYGGVDGDSASAAELIALLSALSRVPVRQSIALTGSVDQLGNIQAIGGVNEKIEGFFDICESRGLTGEQGVMIPASNKEHLMLRDDVIKAIDNGSFHVYAARNIDEGLAILTGREAGMPDEEGNYPEGTINGLVDERLAAFAEARAKYARTTGKADREGADGG